MTSPKKLPIGIQSFPKLIEGGHVYVDKTEDIYRLITGAPARFLSRPRRFGKSLLVSTLKAIFDGRRELFEGLWIAGSDYDWQIFPIIYLDLSRASFETPAQFQSELIRQLTASANWYGLEPGPFQRAAPMLDDLIGRLATKEGSVVVLVDEYDKPILDCIADILKALAIRDLLRGVYTILKAQDENLRFVFLTGVTRFSKVSVFSGLNQLDDISQDRRYATVLGYTQAELESDFSSHLQSAALELDISVPELLVRIRDWYNGYRFHSAAEAVYNPFSCLLYLEKKEFKPWWFETGTPTFLVDLIRNTNLPVPDLERKRVSGNAFSSFEVERLNPLALLQQTGYLTIIGYDAKEGLYTLDYPNREVREAFLTHLAEVFSGREPGTVADDLSRLRNALSANDPDGFFEILTSILAGVPHDIQIRRERYYQSLFYLIFRLMGFHVHAEVRTATGRIDATVELDSGVWIFEFKLDGTAEAALAQIREKDYTEPYRAAGKPVYLVGAGFASEKRNVGEWKVEMLETVIRKETAGTEKKEPLNAQ